MAKAALSLNPTCSAELWNTLGDGLYEWGRTEEARSAYHKALAVNSTDVRSRYNLAWVHTRLKDYPAALDMIAQAMSLDKTGEFRDRLLHKQQEILARLAQKNQQEYLLLINLVSKYAHQQDKDERVRKPSPRGARQDGVTGRTNEGMIFLFPPAPNAATTIPVAFSGALSSWPFCCGYVTMDACLQDLGRNSGPWNLHRHRARGSKVPKPCNMSPFPRRPRRTTASGPPAPVSSTSWSNASAWSFPTWAKIPPATPPACPAAPPKVQRSAARSVGLSAAGGGGGVAGGIFAQVGNAGRGVGP